MRTTVVSRMRQLDPGSLHLVVQVLEESGPLVGVQLLDDLFMQSVMVLVEPLHAIVPVSRCCTFALDAAFRCRAWGIDRLMN